MAQYTITLLEVLKSLALKDLNKRWEEYDSIDELIDDTYMIPFKNYPIFDETYRPILNRKIVEHYVFHEISQAPYSRWEFILNRKLNEIMPYYNQLYETTLLEYDIFNDTDLTETLDREVDVDTSTETARERAMGLKRDTEDINNKNLNVNSKQNEKLDTTGKSESWQNSTPFDYNTSKAKSSPTEMSGEDSSGKSNNQYTTEHSEKEDRKGVVKTNTSEDETSKSNSKLDTLTSEDYVKHLFGKRGAIPYQDIIKKERDNILNIDMMIIRELHTCFRFIFN